MRSERLTALILPRDGEPASWDALERSAGADFRSVNAPVELLLHEALGRRGVKVTAPEQRKRGRPTKGE